MQRVGPDGLYDILEWCRSQIGDGEIEPCPHLPIGVLGKTDRSWLGDTLKPRGDVDPVAHQVAVTFLDNVIHKISA